MDNAAYAQPQAEHSPPRISYEEFLRSAEIEDFSEWVDGEVISMVPPNTRHQDVSIFLATVLNFFLQSRSRGKVFAAPFQMKLAGRPSGREPDLVVVLRENLGNLKEQYLDGPADVAVEIISPESRARDRGEKFYEYEQAGVREYWLIDLDRRKAEFYVLGAGGTYDLAPETPGGVFASRVLDGVHIKAEWLWQEPLPSPGAVLKEWGAI